MRHCQNAQFATGGGEFQAAGLDTECSVGRLGLRPWCNVVDGVGESRQIPSRCHWCLKKNTAMCYVHRAGEFDLRTRTVVDSGVARICCEEGKAGKQVMGHSRRTSGPGTAAAPSLPVIVLWLMRYWSKELWVADICTSWSRGRRLHSIRIVGSQIYYKVN